MWFCNYICGFGISPAVLELRYVVLELGYVGIELPYVVLECVIWFWKYFM